MLDTITRIIELRAVRSWRASRLADSCSLYRLQNALAVFAFTVSLLFSTRDTVATETPASWAIF
jgi:hypothetical protein